MKTNQKQFETVLKMLARCSDPKSSMLILSGVRMHFQRTLGIVDLQTCDLEKSMMTTLQAEFEGDDPLEADIVVNAKAVKAMLGKSKDDTQMEVAVGAGYATITTASGRNKIEYLDGKDFPIMVASSGRKSMFGSYSQADLFDALEFCDRAISEDETRPHISCLKLEKGGKLISTDGHRMHIAQSGIKDFGPYEREEILIPAKACSVLLRMLTDDPEQEFSIHGDADSLRFNIGNYKFYCKNLAGSAEFPPWTQVLPQYMQNDEVKADFIVEVNTDSLFEAVAAVRKTHGKLAYSEILVNGTFRLKSDHPEIGESISEVEVLTNTHEKTHFVFGVNLYYLFDALDNFSDVTRFHFQSNLDPLVVTNAAQGKPDYLAVVMPARVSQEVKAEVDKLNGDSEETATEEKTETETQAEVQ